MTTKVVIVIDGKSAVTKSFIFVPLMPTPTGNIVFIMFAFFAAIQLFYWLFYLIGILRIKRHSSIESPEPVSVVVAAKNEIHNLRALIPALLKQDHPEFEIIIVNDRSDDNTLEFLLELENTNEGLRALHIHDLPEHITGKKYALTLGIKAAKFKNILLTDADCLPVSDSWISTMSNGYKQGGDIVLGFSTYTKLKGFLNSFIRYETLLTGIQYIGSAGNKLPYMGVGRNLGYKKDLFLERKGFHGFQELVGGDDDLFVNKYAKGRFTRVVIGKEAVTKSTPKETWLSFLKQKHRHLHIGKYYSSRSKIAVGLFNLSWIVTYVLALVCIFGGIDPSLVGYSLLTRLVIMLLTIIAGTKRLGITYEWLGVIFLDLIYPIYYIFAGTKALLVKTISWE